MKTPHCFLDSTFEKKVLDGRDISELPSLVEKHLRALRIKDNEKIYFSNGRGLACECHIEKGKIYWHEDHWQKSPAPFVHLFIGRPHKDALMELIRNVTEVGVNRLSLVDCELSQHPLPASWHSRAQRISNTACEQCCRFWTMEIDPKPIPFREVLGLERSKTFVADEALRDSTEERHLPETLSQFNLVLGPEGGWSAKERQYFDHQNFARKSLGEMILRLPTAATVMAFQIRHLWRAPSVP